MRWGVWPPLIFVHSFFFLQDFKRHNDQRKNMAKVFSPKSVQIAKQNRIKKRKENKLKRKHLKELKMQGIDVANHPLYGTHSMGGGSGQLPPIMRRAMEEQQQQQQHNQRRNQEQQGEEHWGFEQHDDQQHQHHQQHQQHHQHHQQHQQHSPDGGMDFSTINEDQVVDEQKYLEQHALHSGSWRAVLPNPNAMSRGKSGSSDVGMGGRRSSRESLQSRGTLTSTSDSMLGSNSNPTTRMLNQRRNSNSTAGTHESSSRGSSMNNGLGPIEGAFEKRRMLMEPKEMSISTTSTSIGIERHVVTVSAFRGVHDRLVYEISDSMTGIVQYYDIPAELILQIGKEYPILLNTKQTARVEKLGYLLDLTNYFGQADNVVAKMFWWQGVQK